MDENTKGIRILKTAGSFPHCLSQISLGWVLLPSWSPLTGLVLSSHPSENRPRVPEEPRLSSVKLHYDPGPAVLGCLGCRMRAGILRARQGQWRQMATGGRFDYLLLPKANPPVTALGPMMDRLPLGRCWRLGLSVTCYSHWSSEMDEPGPSAEGSRGRREAGGGRG